jgi:hypothetical protein
MNARLALGYKVFAGLYLVTGLGWYTYQADWFSAGGYAFAIAVVGGLELHNWWMDR